MTRRPLDCALLTVSDSRTRDDDSAGDLLAGRIETEGHTVAARDLVPDDRYRVRAVLSGWIADPGIDVVITTGGTGFTGRDTTPEAVLPLLDKVVDGFGELFRHVSYGEIGTSTIQSRAIGGLANGTLIFCLPGSKNACATGWDKLLRSQLDIDHKPCNFVELIPRFRE